MSRTASAILLVVVLALGGCTSATVEIVQPQPNNVVEAVAPDPTPSATQESGTALPAGCRLGKATSTNLAIDKSECDALVALHFKTLDPRFVDRFGWSHFNDGGETDPCEWGRVHCESNETTAIDFQSHPRGEIPAELGNLKNLQHLRLMSNDLGGPIPPELGNLTNLTLLQLRGSDFTGPIPPELGNLTNLRTLFLSGHELSGPIPPELGNLTNLDELWLAGHDLSGPIPPEIFKLTNLTTLMLSRNGLVGEIPAQLAALTELRNLHLDGNNVTGPVPSELGQLTKLQVLHLLNNELSGELPASLGDLGIDQLLVAGNGCLTASPTTTLALGAVVANDLDEALNVGC